MNEKNSRLGLALLAVGVLMLLTNLGLLDGQWFLLMLGLGFVGVYALLGGQKAYKNIGFLIPGMVLIAIGSFVLLDSTLPSIAQGGTFFLCLSGAFWGVLVIHTIWFKSADFGDRFWPIFPGVGLLLFSLFIYSQEMWDWHIAAEVWNYVWVVALIGSGTWLLLKDKIKRKQ